MTDLNMMFLFDMIMQKKSLQGVRLKMDDMGNIIIKRMSNCDVFIRGWDRENNSLSKEIIELSGELEFEKSVKLFDMKKFQASTARELRSAYPDRRKLENQCICAIAFVKDSPDLLDMCSWILLINIVALDLLKSRFPAISYNRSGLPLDDHLMMPNRGGVGGSSAPKFISVFDPLDLSNHDPRTIHHNRESRSISDEDPYSVPLQSSSGGSGGGGGGDRTRVSQGQDNNNLHNTDYVSSKNTEVMMHNNNNNNNQRMKKSSSSSPSSGAVINNSERNNQKPPELPPRDFAKIKKSKGKNIPQALKSLVNSGKNGGPNPKGQVAKDDPAPETRADALRRGAGLIRDDTEYGEYSDVVITVTSLFSSLVNVFL